MSMVFRAEDEPVASRLDYWKNVVGETVVPLDFRVPGGPDFRSRLVTGDVGLVRVCEITGPAVRVARTTKLLRRSDPELCKIDVLVRGRAVVEQGGRQAGLGPGDFVFVDLSRPCHWAISPARMVAVTFPRTLLPVPSNDLALLAGVGIPGGRGAGALISSLARQLPRHLGDYRVADGARLSAAVLDLLSVALAARLDRGDEVPPDIRQRALLLRIHRFIEERLADSELSPAAIAAAHHISVRYLYRLFETEGTTVAGWIRRRRLERCRRDLLDPALRAQTVGSIGARWGFADAVHFNRVFRAAYGVPPGEYRLTGNGASLG
ncbi:MAG: helix-turn-helix domain-containing protein [Streptosporangiales bacterium]|nr:helix-turn-helix domain-containing protein [Streptosporangiales bacterium]